VTSLYGLLGVSPDASADEIRHAYYRAARRIHPDLNPEADADAAMRRLNHAWEVLGDPVARRRYDAELRQPIPAPVSVPRQPPTQPPVDEPAPHPPRFLRPSALIVAVLLVIFVVTAYARHDPNNTSRPTSPTSDSTPPPTATSAGPTDLIGNCLDAQPGYDAVVPCTQRNLGQVMMLVANSALCPANTHPYQLIGRVQWVCLRPSTSG
jgi:hypothetical protein